MTTRAPWHLWAVGVLALLFNSFGAYDYLMSKTQGPAYLESMGFTVEQVAHYQAFPVWMTAVWAIGVWGAFAASILLLMRRRQATMVFAVSLGAFVINLIYNYVLTDGAEILGSQNAIMSVVIMGMLIVFMLYARAMAAKGVLR